MPPPTQPSPPDTRTGEASPCDHWLGLFLQHAELHPDRTALISGNRSMTYGDLDKLSDHVAAQLLNAGIGTGHFVGAGFHRSIELIAALLGIVKSGAAYIPLDPGYPAARIQQMIASAKLDTVLTSGEMEGNFPGVRVLRIDDAHAVSSTTPTIGGIDPVYAIFTSGSTGQPKAASVFHSGFGNLLEWYRAELNLGESDRTLVISSPSFDLTQKNLFTPLLTGGTLVLDECQTYDITRILGLIRDHGVSLINCTPSAFYPLVDAAENDGFAAISSLRFAVLGGEPISIPRLRGWLEHPSCRAEVVNSYGPTECTDICLFHRMHKGNLDAFQFVPLGHEIPNVQVTIRNEQLELLADGETGELCISGAGVGGGYLHDSERTADRFVSVSNEKAVYRTGDLAKRLPCGTFEFRGRADHQVKVNGFRIELGEIEIALANHEAVREAVVTARDHKLTAHIQGDAPVAELRDHLASRLPAYMIPTEFRFVETYPLTPNGKVDRKALAESGGVSTGHSQVTDNSLPSRILALWSEILGSTVTDASANFFDLGGNSIHLAVVHVRLREIIGREIPITDLFAHTSAKALAMHLSPQQGTQGASAVHDRARLAKAGFARFQRPLPR